jgi:glycerol-3-phosphate dehydrogenase
MLDGRMNLNSLFTASIDEFIPGMKGASLANYTEMKCLTKDGKGQITGAVCFDSLNNKEFTVKAKCVVNCAGVHADIIRSLDKPDVSPRIVPSRGTHLVFKKGILSGVNGVVIPKTKDGRLIYIINYMGHPMAGTTDEMTDATHDCEPTQEEIDFICSELTPYFGDKYDYKGNL